MIEVDKETFLAFISKQTQRLRKEKPGVNSSWFERKRNAAGEMVDGKAVAKTTADGKYFIMEV